MAKLNKLDYVIGAVVVVAAAAIIFLGPVAQVISPAGAGNICGTVFGFLILYGILRTVAGNIRKK